MDKARSLFLTSLEMVEEDLRPDMTGGDESVDLIPPLTLLSYAAMLAGMARQQAETIKSANRVFSGYPRHAVQLSTDTRDHIWGVEYRLEKLQDKLYAGVVKERRTTSWTWSLGKVISGVRGAAVSHYVSTKRKGARC